MEKGGKKKEKKERIEIIEIFFSRKTLMSTSFGKTGRMRSYSSSDASSVTKDI